MANNTDTSIIWVDGETTGHSGLGIVGTAIPVSESVADTAEIDAAVGALHTRLVASGVLPD